MKQTIIRLDYDYLFEDEIERIVKNSINFLTEKKYKMNSRTLSEYKINVNMEQLNVDNNQAFNMQENNKEEFSSFINKEKDTTINITKNFTTMTVKYNSFEKFENLIEEFNEIVDKIKNIREGFSFNRIGIRKTNFYILKDINQINNYFETNTLDFNKLITDKNKIITKNSMESFLYSDYKVNQMCNTARGVLTDKEKNKEEQVYQVILDIDVYKDEIKDNEINLKDMNDKLFKIYKSALNVDFLENLKKENYDDGVIIRS